MTAFLLLAVSIVLFGSFLSLAAALFAAAAAAAAAAVVVFFGVLGAFLIAHANAVATAASAAATVAFERSFPGTTFRA